MGKTIGSARVIEGLYYFDDHLFRNKMTPSFGGLSSMSVCDKIMLWHLKPRHPSFQYLKHLFPYLFKNLNCSSFQCESCVLAKSHRNTYISKPYRASKPFYMIHSDVWGPLRIKTLSDKKMVCHFH